jgi:hypothetical protein
MTALIPTDPQEREALAGEYVLGTLDARVAASVAGALAADRGLRQAVEAWEDRLTPLASLAVQEAPPPELWGRIEAGLPAIAGGALPKPARGWDLWRVWAIGASLAAAALAGLSMLQATRPTVMEATVAPVPAAVAPIPTAPPSAIAAAPAPMPTAPSSALVTVPASASTLIAPAPPVLVAQPVPDTGVRKATGEANGAVRPAAGVNGGTLRPSGTAELGAILH